MEKKNKRVTNKSAKGKNPNYYKGKNTNNTSKNKSNNKRKKLVVNDVKNIDVIISDEKIDEIEKFKFYENTMAINLEGHIDINDDLVEDYSEVPMLIDVKEDSLDIMKNENEDLKVDAFVNPVDSVNVKNEVEHENNMLEVIDGDDGVNEIGYNDIVASVENVVLEDDDMEDTEVLEVDEIRYSGDVSENAVPEITEVVETINYSAPVVETNVNSPVVETVVETPAVENTVVSNNESFMDMVNVEANSAVNTASVPAKDVGGAKHLNFETRVVFMVLISIIAFVVSTVFIYLAINYSDIEDVVFSETSTVNYSVCLNDNDYYNGDCLGEEMQYISTLTKSVPITFNYDVRYSSDVTYDIEYYVLGKTIIYDRDDASKILYRDDKILTERTNVTGTNSNARVTAKVDVPFKERNDYVNGYKSKYALNSLASYEVVLYADDGNGPKEVASATIPLSTQTFNITEETVMKDNQRMTMKKVGLDSINTVFAIVGVVFLVAGLIVLVKLFILVYKTLGGNANAYEKKLNQILTEYDRVIVISKSEYAIDPEKQFIKVDSFYELLDARDTLEKPIVYERVNSVKSFFYVEDNDRIYRYAMKESDFEKKEK